MVPMERFRSNLKSYIRFILTFVTINRLLAATILYQELRINTITILIIAIGFICNVEEIFNSSQHYET